MSAAPAPPPPPPPAAPVPPPRSEAETLRTILALARSLALVMALVAGLLFLVLLILGVVEALFGAVPTDLAGVVYTLVSAIVNYLVWRELPALEGLAARGAYAELKDRLLLWTVLGFLFFVVVGVVLVVAWVKLDALGRSAPVGAPAVPPPTGVAPTCPRCGASPRWVAEAQRYYCDRCGAYV